MTIPESVNLELFIVDNNSKDNTREVVESFIRNSEINCKYFIEKNQGLSYARNCGISNAKGDIIVFTDDDVLVDEDWLKNIAKAFEKNNAACIGGKILPLWEKPPPRWLKGKLLYDIIALCDLGDETIKLSEPKVWGANLSFKASIFQKYGHFNVQLGHIGGKLYGGEETKYLQELIYAGESVMYSPDILVYHCIPESRLKKKYFRKWIYDKGELSAIQMGEYNNRNIFGIPFYVFKKTIKELVKCVQKQILNHDDAFPSQFDLFFNLGLIKGRVKYIKQRKQALN